MKRTEKWGVYAAKSGTVIAVLKTSSKYGLRIYIEHKDGYRTLYAHNLENLVEHGQEVKKGELIAIMGQSGSDNKHGHFGLVPPHKPLTELKKNCVNPVPWLVDGGAYPYNTKVTYGFQHWYDTLFHEGIDFSGLSKNIIKGWKRGIEANTMRYYA